MLKASQIEVRLGGAPIIKPISLNVPAGALVAVLGANGAGKSTLLNALAGELPLHGGSITLHGRPLQAWSSVAMARFRSVLSQQRQLPFALTVLETVQLGRFPYHREESEQASRRIAAQLLDEAGLYHFSSRLMPTLSGGEQQRIHFLRALAQLHEPREDRAKLLLLDEPTSSLDIAQQHRLLDQARQLTRRDNLGVFAILHDINQAAQYADHILMLRQGKLVAAGSPAEVLRPAHIRQVFGVEAVVSYHPELARPQVSTFFHQKTPA